VNNDDVDVDDDDDNDNPMPNRHRKTDVSALSIISRRCVNRDEAPRVPRNSRPPASFALSLSGQLKSLPWQAGPSLVTEGITHAKRGIARSIASYGPRSQHDPEKHTRTCCTKVAGPGYQRSTAPGRRSADPRVTSRARNWTTPAVNILYIQGEEPQRQPSGAAVDERHMLNILEHGMAFTRLGAQTNMYIY